MSYDFKEKINPTHSGSNDEITVLRHDRLKFFCISLKSEEPIDSWGIEWKPTEEAVALTKEEMINLKKIIDKSLEGVEWTD